MVKVCLTTRSIPTRPIHPVRRTFVRIKPTITTLRVRLGVETAPHAAREELEHTMAVSVARYFNLSIKNFPSYPSCSIVAGSLCSCFHSRFQSTPDLPLYQQSASSQRVIVVMEIPFFSTQSKITAPNLLMLTEVHS